MLLFRKHILLTLTVCCCLAAARAQHTFNSNAGPRLHALQDSMIHLTESIQAAKENTDRFAANASLIKTLVTALKIPGSYSFAFDSLKYISTVKSPDNSFRIFSWALPTNSGSFRFFGTIQMATKDGSLKLFPLIDGTAEFKDDNEVTSPKKWFGSRYYEIVPVVNSGKQTYYALLGWKGNNAKTSKKVIEVLSFNQGEPIFGKAVFQDAKNSSVKNRIVFEYSKLNSMTLRLDKKIGMIVFDHLAPLSPEMADHFEFYASDSSFDAYKPVGGRLKLVENVEVNNDPDTNDEFYIDPKNKQIPAQKKF